MGIRWARAQILGVGRNWGLGFGKIGYGGLAALALSIATINTSTTLLYTCISTLHPANAEPET